MSTLSATSAKESPAQSTSWTGNVWIQDEWTDEDKFQARDRLAAASRQQQKQQERKQEQKRAFREFRRNASTNWNVFYQQNKTNFFKDRHYLHKAFPKEFGWLYAHSDDDVANVGDDNEAVESATSGTVCCDEYDADIYDKHDIAIVEIGCGVGNAILPLLEQHSELVKQYNEEATNGLLTCNNRHATPRAPPQLHIHCLDFAPTAIQLLKEDPRFQSAAREGRATGHVYDLSSMHPSSIFIGNSPDGTQPHEQKSQQVLANSADVAILLFCLSAIGPHRSPSLARAARNVIDMLKPGGTLVIRDYGRLDEAQMKLGTQEKELGDNFYRKGDGTGCNFFELDDLNELFVNKNADDDKLELLELDYIQRVYRNRGDETTRRRVWVQGRFRKPLNAVPTDTNDGNGAIVGGIGTSTETLKQFLDTLIERWDDYYRVLSATSASAPLPSNLFQIFPSEFQPWALWQPSKNKGKRQRPPQSASQSHAISDVTVFDLGCGIGNGTLLNLVEKQQLLFEVEQQQECQSTSLREISKPPTLNAHFIDASNEAILKLRSDPRYKQTVLASNKNTAGESKPASITSEVCNLATPQAATAHLDSANIILLLFTLSAIGPHLPQHQRSNQPRFSGIVNAVKNAANMLKPGGVILFRDYARYDDDQLLMYATHHDSVFILSTPLVTYDGFILLNDRVELSSWCTAL
ncbi:LOW QUALITY PROTEIN: hypothetical protein ACHAXR_003022 [Thalassiosira sp. AJA248-18]